MKTIVISDNDRGGTYLRVNKMVAQKIFEEGTGRLYVMTSDRNPVTSLTTAHEYKKGCMPYFTISYVSIETFDQLITDFKKWVMYRGYGYERDPYRANKELFSYWVKIGE